jgi:hypothetical protein
MKKIIYVLALIVFTLSCEEKKTNQNVIKQTRKQVLPKPIPKRFRDYLSNEKDFIWCAKQSDSSPYLVRLIFKEEYVVYQFHGQCFYYFFSDYFYTGADKIGLIWSYKTDCLLDMDFLQQSNGVKKFPKFGEPFSEYELVNDSTIHVKYNFQAWVKEINKKQKDSIFPNYLYLKKDVGL